MRASLGACVTEDVALEAPDQLQHGPLKTAQLHLCESTAGACGRWDYRASRFALSRGLWIFSIWAHYAIRPGILLRRSQLWRNKVVSLFTRSVPYA